MKLFYFLLACPECSTIIQSNVIREFKVNRCLEWDEVLISVISTLHSFFSTCSNIYKTNIKLNVYFKNYNKFIRLWRYPTSDLVNISTQKKRGNKWFQMRHTHANNSNQTMDANFLCTCLVTWNSWSTWQYFKYRLWHEIIPRNLFKGVVQL